VIYLDRSRAPETEAWLFHTAEVPLQEGEYPLGEAERVVRKRNKYAYSQSLALLKEAQRIGIPENGSVYHGDDPNILLLGGVHETIFRGLKSKGADLDASSARGLSNNASGASSENASNERSDGLLRGHTTPWLKFLYSPKAISAQSAADELPSDFVWSAVQDEEHQLVISRSSIKRTPATLALLPSVAIRAKRSGTLAAWAFLSPDGSIASLHTEDQHRRRGLAKAIGKRLMEGVGTSQMEDGRKHFEDVAEGQTWCHSDTAEDNWGSIGVAKALGGQPGWRCYWTQVDLEEVKKASIEDV